PQVDAAQAKWEAEVLANKPIAWTVLDPHIHRTHSGATLKKLADKSLLAGGANPATDTYVIFANTDAASLTAIKVEALPDDSLPAKGPGRSENGNFVLTGVKLERSSSLSNRVFDLKLTSASADFSQKDFPVAGALTGKPGWAIHPQVGKPHYAIFQLEKP